MTHKTLASSVPPMLLASSPARRLGVDDAQATVRFGEGPKAEHAWAGHRLLMLDGRPAFELSYWCGTCPVLFERLEGANRTLSLPDMEEKLAHGVDGIDEATVATYSPLLPSAQYVAMLLRVTPRLVYPASAGDYFAHEQVQTWGANSFWGLPESPRTPYYRTFETPVNGDAHLYEFIAPMVPPSWNDRDRVERYSRFLQVDARATAVAVSTLDVSQPANDMKAGDNYEHWALTHFLLDGHHRMEAAAAVGQPIQLLSLVSLDASLADEDQLGRLLTIRARQPGERPHQQDQQS